MTDAAGAKKKEIQLRIGEELSTAIIGNVKVDVSADGKKVTAYTNDGVETKAVVESMGNSVKAFIGADFNMITLNGVTIEQADDGHLVITAPGATVQVKPAVANDIVLSPEALKIGAKMEDGAVFVGISPDTNAAMFSAAADEPLTLAFNSAKERASAVSKMTGKAYRVPSEAELKALFNNCAAVGGFEQGGIFPTGWYWSSASTDEVEAKATRFSDGASLGVGKGNKLALRLIRS